MPDKLENSQPHIVEFGCATGLLLSLIKKNGYANLTGVDPSPSCTETAEKHYGIKVLTNTLSDATIEDGSVDMLILVGVLYISSWSRININIGISNNNF